MAAPKEKRPDRVAGKRKFELPPRETRVITDNPVRDLLQEIGREAGATEPLAPPLIEAPQPQIPAVPQLREVRKGKVRTPRTRTPGETRMTTSVVVERGASFEHFRQKYGPLLGRSRLAVCEALYDLSHGLGQQECFYSVGKLAEATGFTDRYLFKLVGQLESYGFIEKVEIFNTATKKGTLFRLHLEPVIKAD